MTLEFAISLFGIVVFLMVVLRTWVWFNTMLVERQVSFQQTRLIAGQEATAGTPVPYQRPLLTLIGAPGSVGGEPGIGPPPPPPPPPCAAAEPFFDEAELHMQRAQELQAQALPHFERADELGKEIEALEVEINDLNARIAALEPRCIPPGE